MTEEIKAKNIMTKPLPQILDEIDDSVRLTKEAAKSAREAAEAARSTLEVYEELL